MAHPVFFARFLADAVQKLRILVRTHGKSGREVVEAVLFGLESRALEPQIKAFFTPRAALALLLIALCGFGELPVVIFAFEEFYAVLGRQQGDYSALLAEPVFVFLGGVDVGVEVEHGDVEIFRQIFEHIAAARPAAAVKQQGRHAPVIFYFFDLAVEGELIIYLVHL